MKNSKQILEEITTLTTKIETDYPELYRYLDEEPLTLPEKPHPKMDEEQLNDYLESLQQLLKHHLETHELGKEG
ncbi:hypothetical protein [Maribacter sp. ACAM166]|uniref:hypothetical protein n=1 Tax=Maribacter sp. ACAM166 TaxID=2508996 RepID=UPI0010FE7ADC|nr:hypothetical protein [Maribacter sp. ACAM166]TLP81800.1 hypothetical protein ES765_03705 [Maribacter sp. ACAM166]